MCKPHREYNKPHCKSRPWRWFSERFLQVNRAGSNRIEEQTSAVAIKPTERIFSPTMIVNSLSPGTIPNGPFREIDEFW